MSGLWRSAARIFLTAVSVTRPKAMKKAGWRGETLVALARLPAGMLPNRIREGGQVGSGPVRDEPLLGPLRVRLPHPVAESVRGPGGDYGPVNARRQPCPLIGEIRRIHPFRALPQGAGAKARRAPAPAGDGQGAVARKGVSARESPLPPGHRPPAGSRQVPSIKESLI